MLDFQEAYLGGNETLILAEALSEFIKSQTANNPDIMKRYAAARARRGKPP